jgi:hypothetical protein
MGLNNVHAARAMLYPAYSECGTCNRKHLYMAFTPSHLALLKELVGRHKEKKARKTLKCIQMSLDVPKDENCNHGLFRCAHCNNEYIAVEMSDRELKYLKQILDHIWCPCSGVPRPNDSGSNTDDSTRHRLTNVLYMPPIPNVRQILKDHSIGQIDKALDRYPDLHIRVWQN